MAGRWVRRERRDLRVDIEVVEGMVRAVVSPAIFLTKTCIVSSVSEDDEQFELADMDLDERILEK